MSLENLEEDFQKRLKQIEVDREEGILKDVEPYYEISILLPSKLITKAKAESTKQQILLQEAIIDIIRDPAYDFSIVDPTDEIVEEMDRLNQTAPDSIEDYAEEFDYEDGLLLNKIIEVDVQPWSDEDPLVGRYLITEPHALYNKFVF